MASLPPSRTRPSGEITMPRHTRTKMLPAIRKNQSSDPVSQLRRSLNAGPSEFWKASVITTKAMTTRLEIANTGLWMSRPNGPILGWMLF